MKRKQIYDTKRAKQAICSILTGSLLVSGCATTGYRAQTLASVTEEDRKACEEFARAEAARRMPGSSQEDVNKGVLISSFLFGPFMLFALPVIVAGSLEAHENDKARRPIYAQALGECLEPPSLEQAQRTEHPDVAQRLHSLANRYSVRKRYADAEPLYQRAIAIREESLGSEHPGLVRILEDYAELLLRRTNRVSEAEKVEVKAKRIRASLDQEHRFPRERSNLDQPQ